MGLIVAPRGFGHGCTELSLNFSHFHENSKLVKCCPEENLVVELLIRIDHNLSTPIKS